jgi:hypothetical protein
MALCFNILFYIWIYEMMFDTSRADLLERIAHAMRNGEAVFALDAVEQQHLREIVQACGCEDVAEALSLSIKMLHQHLCYQNLMKKGKESIPVWEPFEMGEDHPDTREPDPKSDTADELMSVVVDAQDIARRIRVAIGGIVGLPHSVRWHDVYDNCKAQVDELDGYLRSVLDQADKAHRNPSKS